ncbi:lysozyme inhibitor LprI family protein [Pseudoroseicyclus sp. H15]
MKALYLAGALLAASALPAAAQVDCSAGGVTQADMNHCALVEYRETDAVLNDTWGEIRARLDLKGPVYAALLEAQRLWIDYRDAACAAEVAQYEGGSMAPMIESLCYTRLTAARTIDLRQFLTP